MTLITVDTESNTSMDLDTPLISTTPTTIPTTTPTIIPTTIPTTIPIVEEHSFTFVNSLVDKFYAFMAEIYIEHQKLKFKYAKDLLNGIVNKPLQPFPQYFLFKLFYNYGVKRRMSNDYIALLYYSKSAKGYKKTEPITMLCRHMLIDLRSMRIISLGIPKSVKIDEFCKTYAIDKTNCDTNGDKYRLYYFTEGTMMTYNPSLKKYNITIVNTDSDDEDLENPEPKAAFVKKTDKTAKIEDNDLEDYEIVNLDSKDTVTDTDTTVIDTVTDTLDSLDLEKSIEIKFNNQFMYSTRKVLGTGSFGSNKSFLDMFEENNKVYNTDLSLIPSNLIKDTVLVFNIEHPENNIISTIKRNTNTLCAVFRFKPELDTEREFSDIISNSNSSNTSYNPTDDTSEDNFTTLMYEKFKILGTNMITQIQVSNYKKYLTDNNVNVNLYLPKVVKKFEKVTTDATHFTEVKEQIDINKISISELETMVNNKSKYFHGYILYGLNGERSKITNQKYKDLCELKGNKPITIDQTNNKNLFYLYCRLLKQKNVNKFLKEFDTEVSMGGTSYKQIFMWFYTLIHNYSLSLFKVYHYSFVKKSFNKPDIPYDLKPLCGDLHTMYKSNNTPITNTIIEQYLFDLPASKLFWRLFKTPPELSSDTSIPSIPIIPIIPSIPSDTISSN